MAEQTYAQYLAEQAGGKLPMNIGGMLLGAAGRNAAARANGMPLLTNEQQAAASRQGLAGRALRDVRYDGGKWLNLNGGGEYKGPGDTFWSNVPANYMRQNAGMTNINRGIKTFENGLPDGGEAGMGTPQIPSQDPPKDPPTTNPNTTRPRTPYPQGQPGYSAPENSGGGGGGGGGGAPPSTRNPITDPPQPWAPPVGTNAPIWQPQNLKAFDPTQLLLALRNATAQGHLRGSNSVQESILQYLANAMR